MDALQAAKMAKAAYSGGEFTVCGNVLSFRGSDDVADWIHDFQACEIRQHSHYPGLVHDGFATLLELLWPQIKPLLPPPGEIIVLGHSLGGALATLASVRLQRLGYTPVVYSFGSPRVGNRVFAEYYTIEHYRWVNKCDIVPHLPPVALLDDLAYRHVGTEQWINQRGRVSRMSEDFLSMVFSLGMLCVEDHYVQNYIDSITALNSVVKGPSMLQSVTNLFSSKPSPSVKAAAAASPSPSVFSQIVSEIKSLVGSLTPAEIAELATFFAGAHAAASSAAAAKPAAAPVASTATTEPATAAPVANPTNPAAAG